MISRSLLVLMWKHGMVRKRRFIHTAVDFLSPLLLFIILYYFRNALNPIPQSGFVEPVDVIQDTDIIPLREEPGPSRIYYYPDTPLTGALMDAVGEQLYMGKLPYEASDGSTRPNGYIALSNESLVTSGEIHLGFNDAFVIFQDMQGEELPKKLNYTIRMNQSFHTSSYRPEEDLLGPHRQFGRMYESFMRLQWAIDTSYIKLLTNTDVALEVSLREFPYYKTLRNESITVISLVLLWACWFSLMITFVFLMSRLLSERTTGIQELVKMVGVSVHTLGLSHFLSVLPAGLAFAAAGALLLRVGDNPLVPRASPALVALLLLLYFVSVVAMAFACSYLARSTQYAVTISVFAYIVLCIPMRVAADRASVPRPLLPLLGALPHVPLHWFSLEISSLEQYGIALDMKTMWSHHTNASCSVFLCYLFLVLQSVYFFGLAWYLSLVRPGKYGQAQPWNFLFKRNYWTKNEIKPQIENEEEEYIAKDPKYFESAPRDAEVGIRVANVTKVYPQHVALKNVSLDVYKGEITVLLGHNGAGKTTLMSIITGMTNTTEGKVYVNGKDTETQLTEVRQHLGLCPQHNLFFPDLTVLQHIMFFTLLKRGSFGEARRSSLALMRTLGLAGKAGALCGALSGGMKRRVQLGCALAGGADLLVLDEPTSGLDVETRRELWDLLLSLRGSRTVLLSTHFMEEADALGDRVAALHSGRLRCFATTMHLKKAIGTGYRLTFTTLGAPDEAAIGAVVKAHVRDAALKDRTYNSLAYSLPAAASDRFPDMFAALEAERAELGIDTTGVGVSTLEEVFLKLCSDVDMQLSDDETDMCTSELTCDKLTGFPLYRRQLYVLLKRQVKYMMHRKWSFLILQVILPMLAIFVLTSASNADLAPAGPNGRAALDLRLYKDMADARVLLDRDDAAARALRSQHQRVRFERVDNITAAILESGKRDIFEYNKYIAGIELRNTTAEILFTTTVRHAAPVALNLLSNAVAAQLLPPAAEPLITTVNHPLADRADAPLTFAEPKSAAATFFWAGAIMFIILATYINLVSLACSERLAGTRHIHVMGGCPAELHWAATLLAHLALSAATLALPALLAAYFVDADRTLSDATFLAMFALVLLATSLAFFASMYLVSFLYGERTANIVLVGSIIVFGVITTSIQAAIEVFPEEQAGALYYVASACGLVAPPHAAVAAAVKSTLVARANAYCDLNRHRCPNLGNLEFVFDKDKCCAGKAPACYLCFEKTSPFFEIIVLFVQFFIYMTMVILCERGVFSYMWDRLVNMRYRPQPQTDASDAVRAEAKYVAPTIELPRKQIPDAMLVDNVHKRYMGLIGKSCNAVQGISFSVKKGECFGLLGVNGAGKSTTFKMLTAELCATRGRIFANGSHVGTCNNGKYLESLGYCPQFFGLDGFLTGKENLTLMLTLRGFTPDYIECEVESWIKIVGLEKYAARAVATYSGGMARRLGAAAALGGRAALALLDEPTAGVDVAARRRVWAALRRGLRGRRSVLITSHSMDEMEALCARIAIVAGGRVRALGSAAQLRAAHSAGHAVVFKLRHEPPADEVDGPKLTDKLKSQLHQLFNCTLKDEHKTMLHFHINDSLHYSKLFLQLEELKRAFPALIEDYSVTETTLEEVFLSFGAKAQGPTHV